MFVLLVLSGLVAGFIDSIAGGGGLITVPVFSLLLGPGATAIGTNKIVAVVSTLVSLLVYMRLGHVAWKGNRRFAALAGAGSALGAWLSPAIPAEVYRWLIAAIAPVMLWIILRKDLWVKREDGHASSKPGVRALWLSGLACGFYDGVAGPGGGTLMFLSLFLLARLPLIEAMATAKLANLSSATLALISFSVSGHVRLQAGLQMGGGIALGALLGANLASRNAAPWARAALLIVTTGLVFKLIST